jgi:NAD(P)-dependent dehydrogenase (short-subunit alcohol dehydrogenase family)
MSATLIGQRVATVQGDVQNVLDLDRLFARVKGEKGSIDVLVANSGFIDPQSLVDTTEGDRTFGTNVRRLLFTVQKALPLLSDAPQLYEL